MSKDTVQETVRDLCQSSSDGHATSRKDVAAHWPVCEGGAEVVFSDSF